MLFLTKESVYPCDSFYTICELCTLDCKLLNRNAQRERLNRVSKWWSLGSLQGFCPAHVHLLCTLSTKATGVNMRGGTFTVNTVNRSRLQDQLIQPCTTISFFIKTIFVCSVSIDSDTTVFIGKRNRAKQSFEWTEQALLHSVMQSSGRQSTVSGVAWFENLIVEKQSKMTPVNRISDVQQTYYTNVCNCYIMPKGT